MRMKFRGYKEKTRIIRTALEIKERDCGPSHVAEIVTLMKGYTLYFKLVTLKLSVLDGNVL